MKDIKIYTGKEAIEFDISDDFTYEILVPNEYSIIDDFKEKLRESLGNPIASQTLREIVKPGQKICLIVNDNTRYVPQDVIVPEIIDELRRAEVEEKDITIVVATGTHRANTEEELEEMLGKEITKRIKIENHDAYNEETLICVGRTKKFSIPIVLNKTVVESDVRIGIGVIEPHLFAGYSGGVKIMSVGTAGYETIKATHNAKMLEHPNTKFGVIENNIFREFLNETASIIKVDFIVNIVQNEEKKPLGIFAGDPIEAFKKGVEFARRVYEVPASKQADIVISVPKFPKTINLYQATRAANSVIFGEKPLVKKGGYLIMPARCWDGFGSQEFYDDLANAKDPDEIIQNAREHGFPPEGHKAFTIARILKHCKIFITDTDISKEKIEAMHMNYAKNVDKALEEIKKECYDKNMHVAVLPDGCITIPKLS
ncbi:MAG: lactate racemase [Thermosediminibacterales bacterium]|nr:lactate racemase [Thermosediminibacterales bacterium]